MSWNTVSSLHKNAVCSHAPRERVSWNVTYLLYIVFRCRHAPRERVSWNYSGFATGTNYQGHAPRERVSWNTKTRLNFNTQSLVTLHVSVWVEIFVSGKGFCFLVSRSTWACELKFINFYRICLVIRSRSTWACELKYAINTLFYSYSMVTLHVSVWVEILWNVLLKCTNAVTLHVSVWVEITRSLWNVSLCRVTLHVSVWVEIWQWSYWELNRKSRSTWACELKCGDIQQRHMERRHAPRERVSWNVK